MTSEEHMPAACPVSNSPPMGLVNVIGAILPGGSWQRCHILYAAHC